MNWQDEIVSDKDILLGKPTNKFSARQSREVFNRKNHFPLFS